MLHEICSNACRYDERFVNKTYGKERRKFGSSKLAESLLERHPVDLFLDDVDTYICDDHPTLHVFAREEATVKKASEFLQDVGYEYIEIQNTKEAGWYLWLKRDSEPVLVCQNEQLYRADHAEYRLLINLFEKRPDYALIAEIYQKDMELRAHTKSFLELARNQILELQI